MADALERLASIARRSAVLLSAEEVLHFQRFALLQLASAFARVEVISRTEFQEEAGQMWDRNEPLGKAGEALLAYHLRNRPS